MSSRFLNLNLETMLLNLGRVVLRSSLTGLSLEMVSQETLELAHGLAS